MPKKNIELLRRLRTRFLRMRHPQHFDMKVIAAKTDCGATMCMIGHILILSGYKMRLREQSSSDVIARLDFDFVSPTGRRVPDTFKQAQRLLGFSYAEASRLFMDYSLKTPKQAAKRIEALINEG